MAHIVGLSYKKKKRPLLGSSVAALNNPLDHESSAYFSNTSFLVDVADYVPRWRIFGSLDLPRLLEKALWYPLYFRNKSEVLGRLYNRI